MLIVRTLSSKKAMSIDWAAPVAVTASRAAARIEKSGATARVRRTTPVVDCVAPWGATSGGAAEASRPATAAKNEKANAARRADPERMDMRILPGYLMAARPVPGTLRSDASARLRDGSG